MAGKQFSDLTPQQQGIVLALLPLVLAAVVYYEMLMPLGEKANALKTQWATLHAQNLRGRALESQRADLVKRIAEANKQLSTLEQIVPDTPAEDQFVKMVYGTAALSSVHVRSFIEQPPLRQAYDTEMPFGLHLDGTYFAILDFFNRLESSARIVNVSDLTLGPPVGTGGKGVYKIGPQETVGANCTLTTFYNSPPPPPVKKPPGAPRR